MADSLPLKPGMPKGISKPTRASRSGGSGGSYRVAGADGERFDAKAKTKQLNVGKMKKKVK